MAEEQAKATEEQEQVVEENTIEQRMAALEAKYKSEIAGLNRKVSEKDEAVKRYEREKMSDTERLEAERKEIEAERAKIESERKTLTNQKITEAELRNAGLSLEFAKRIHGETEAEIKADVQALKEMFESNVSQVVEKVVNERLAGKSPKGTEETKNTIARSEFDKLSDYERMTKIKSGVKVVEG